MEQNDVIDPVCQRYAARRVFESPLLTAVLRSGVIASTLTLSSLGCPSLNNVHVAHYPNLLKFRRIAFRYSNKMSHVSMRITRIRRWPVIHDRETSYLQYLSDQTGMRDLATG